MNLKKVLPILVLGIVPAHATVIFIDNFTTPQLVSVDVNTPSAESGLPASPNVFGSARTVEMTQTAGDIDSVLTDSTQIGGGSLFFSLAAADAGTSLLIWDGDTVAGVNPFVLAPTDLTDGGANSYIGLSIRSDLVAPITLTFYSGANSGSYILNTPGAGFGAYTNYWIPMTSFAGVDFTAVTAASMFIDGQNAGGVDLQIRNLAATPTPEPASFGLVAAGLAGLYFRRHRKA